MNIKGIFAKCVYFFIYFFGEKRSGSNKLTAADNRTVYIDLWQKDS